MSKDKYPSIFSPQMKAIVVIILQIFYATLAVLKIGEYPLGEYLRIFPSFSWGIFSQLTRLHQSRERKYLIDYKLLYSSIIVCITFAQYCTLLIGTWGHEKQQNKLVE